MARIHPSKRYSIGGEKGKGKGKGKALPMPTTRTISSGKQPKKSLRRQCQKVLASKRVPTPPTPVSKTTQPISLKAMGELLQKLYPGKLNMPEQFCRQLMYVFVENPRRRLRPPCEIGIYRALDSDLVAPIMDKTDARFPELCSFLGNALGVWSDYLPWSTILTPMIFSQSFPYPLWGFESKYNKQNLSMCYF